MSHSDLDLLGQEVPLRVEALRCFHQTLFSLKTWWNISWFKNQVKYSSTASCSETGSETGSGRCVPGSCLCVRPSPPPDPAEPSAACWQTAGRFHSPHWPVRSPRTPHTAPCRPMSAGTAAPEETHTRCLFHSVIVGTFYGLLMQLYVSLQFESGCYLVGLLQAGLLLLTVVDQSVPAVRQLSESRSNLQFRWGRVGQQLLSFLWHHSVSSLYLLWIIHLIVQIVMIISNVVEIM